MSFVERALHELTESGALNNSENGRPARWRLEEAEAALRKAYEMSEEHGVLFSLATDPLPRGMVEAGYYRFRSYQSRARRLFGMSS